MNQQNSGAVSTYVKPGDTGFAQRTCVSATNTSRPWQPSSSSATSAKTPPSTIPAVFCFFRDHLTFLDEVISEERRSWACSIWRRSSSSSSRFAAKQGIKLHGELKDRKGSEGICHSIVLEKLRPSGAAQHRLGFAHATRGGDRLRGVWHWHDGRFQFWITKDVRVKVPESVRVVIRGSGIPTSPPKTFILKILSLDTFAAARPWPK